MIRCTRPALLAAFLSAAALCVPVSVDAQASYEVPPATEGPHTRHPEAEKAMDRLKSPYCPGFMLEVCTSAQGAALRDSLQMMAEAGADADSIVAWVLANHGSQWLALPEPRGRGLVAWVVPGLAILLGIGAVVVALRVMARGRPAPERDRPISSDEEERLREALRELDVEERAPL
ncbi:MAG: cytochrome c-type biogenesis protein CcmH [Gemmatimonadetes bacterium]|nr:cytochrome c-type biogenesis protein CcmH [Gemmatimonadota bacterium]